MKKKVVIKGSSLPMRSPIGTAIVYWLLLEHINAPGWAYGVLWTLAAILGIAYAASFFLEVDRDVPGFGERD